MKNLKITPVENFSVMEYMNQSGNPECNNYGQR